MATERFTISIASEEIDRFERGRAKLGMNKSAYVRYLIDEHEGKEPSFVKYREIIELLAELNLHMNTIILQPETSEHDRMLLAEKISETNKRLKKLTGG